MTKIKKIGWESWSTKEKDWLTANKLQPQEAGMMDMDSLEEEEDWSPFQESEKLGKEDKFEFYDPRPSYLYTPFGVFDPKSMLKPSDRWDCWIAHANFLFKKEHLDILNDKIEGIAKLVFLDGYTFCIGIPKMFDSSEVKEEIEKRLYEV